ncbi:VOC family protein [Pararhizobium mangrovi]|uniref:hypothetical protein n=1 Tax=Pararhizobium mangrovi TaxID=2590452 RepID=UPI001F23A90C|nr:hypothetical protein [Pararhizobium mangrovi]
MNYGAGQFCFSVVTSTDGTPASVGNGVHVAFEAGDRPMIDAFYRPALNCDGTEDGQPGLRPEYNTNYYGVFVFDPDGNKIEAVTYSARK